VHFNQQTGTWCPWYHSIPMCGKRNYESSSFDNTAWISYRPTVFICLKASNIKEICCQHEGFTILTSILTIPQCSPEIALHIFLHSSDKYMHENMYCMKIIIQYKNNTINKEKKAARGFCRVKVLLSINF